MTAATCDYCGRTERDGAEFGEFNNNFSKPVCDACGWKRELARPELKAESKLPVEIKLGVVVFIVAMAIRIWRAAL